MTEAIDGFYSAFLTGKVGSGFLMFTIRHGVIVGADILGLLYDGQIVKEDNAHAVTLNVKFPPNTPLIQGNIVSPYGDNEELHFLLPRDFLSAPFVRIEGKNGPVNARFVKIRDLNE
jgi:hypothetical protein